MTTWIAIVALAGSLASANIPEPPKWEKNYYDARTWAVQRQKPLAVFIGSGVSGWEKVSKDGSFDPKVYQLLKEKYVCVYIDSDTEAGKGLAKRFEVAGKGLVIGDKTGNTQAFHHSGEMSKTLLVKAIERYADAGEAKSTETAAVLEPPPRQISELLPELSELCSWLQQLPERQLPEVKWRL
jgi:hypothetical protein